MFTAPDGNHLRRAKTSVGATSWFNAALERSGIERLTPHDLRHTAASLAISSGANVKAVQRMLGHKSAAMTLDTYADLFEDDLVRMKLRFVSLRSLNDREPASCVSSRSARSTTESRRAAFRLAPLAQRPRAGELRFVSLRSLNDRGPTSCETARPCSTPTKRARDPRDCAALGPSSVTAVCGDGGNRTPVHR
ncbi:site-specific integrase [Microbacterium cremeum]|uniref:site-specific integrase n=1 Tax=Microbacterium cremeum TaxID=2782169 RepID=UPI001F3B89A4|nr:site-specific integrase [Microbacterium cremeum]